MFRQHGGYTPLPRRFFRDDETGVNPPSQAAQMLIKQGGCVSEEAGTFFKMPGGEFSSPPQQLGAGSICHCGADCPCRRGGRCGCGARGCRCAHGRDGRGCGCGRGCGRGCGCGGVAQCGGGPVGAPLTTTCPDFKPLQYNFDPAQGTEWNPAEEGQKGCSCAYSR